MKRDDLVRQLNKYDAADFPDEEKFRQQMLKLLRTEPDCFHRACFPAHFTGSALVVSADGERILLTRHKFLNKWLQLGGHCDGEADVLRVAVREAEEESGISGFTIASEKPLNIDIHSIPQNPQRNEPAHFHYDVHYLLIAPEKAVFRASDESHELRWFTFEEFFSLPFNPGLVRLVGKLHSLG